MWQRLAITTAKRSYIDRKNRGKLNHCTEAENDVSTAKPMEQK